MAESNGNNLSSRERNILAGSRTGLNLSDLESKKDQEKEKKRGKLLSKKAK